MRDGITPAVQGREGCAAKTASPVLFSNLQVITAPPCFLDWYPTCFCSQLAKLMNKVPLGKRNSSSCESTTALEQSTIMFWWDQQSA